MVRKTLFRQVDSVFESFVADRAVFFATNDDRAPCRKVAQPANHDLIRRGELVSDSLSFESVDGGQDVGMKRSGWGCCRHGQVAPGMDL